jgi:hypothetical protein
VTADPLADPATDAITVIRCYPLLLELPRMPALESAALEFSS